MKCEYEKLMGNKNCVDCKHKNICLEYLQEHTAELEAELATIKAETLDRVEADVETIKALYPKNKYTTIGFKDFKAKVKSAIVDAVAPVVVMLTVVKSAACAPEIAPNDPAPTFIFKVVALFASLVLLFNCKVPDAVELPVKVTVVPT